MHGIHEVQEKVVEFFSREFGREREAVHFLKVSKSGEEWVARVEVTEPNEYLKKLGYPQIFDRNVYTIKLDPSFEITEYGLTESRERTYATEEREEV
jgi:hypothetical protein